MKVIVRAFNAQNYHRDIVIMDEQQVRMSCGGVRRASPGEALDLVAVTINLKDFPEVDRFVVVIKNDGR